MPSSWVFSSFEPAGAVTAPPMAQIKRLFGRGAWEVGERPNNASWFCRPECGKTEPAGVARVSSSGSNRISCRLKLVARSCLRTKVWGTGSRSTAGRANVDSYEGEEMGRCHSGFPSVPPDHERIPLWICWGSRYGDKD